MQVEASQQGGWATKRGRWWREVTCAGARARCCEQQPPLYSVVDLPHGLDCQARVVGQRGQLDGATMLVAAPS